jgi:CBS domain-containing protein
MAGIFVTTAGKSLRDKMQGFIETGSIMSLATKDVVTIPPTSTIMSAIELMVKNRFRRIPVTDSGSGRLLGILGSSDIVDLIGGGKKFQLISEAHGGNFLSAINDSVRRVMNTDILTINSRGSGKEGLDRLLSSNRGGLVVVDKDNNVKGIVTERDFIDIALRDADTKKVANYMTSGVITATPGTTLGDAAKIMVRNSFRRLPIVSEDRLVGMVTTRSLINFIGQNGVFNKLVKNDIEEILKMRVSEVMGHSSATVDSGSDIRTAAGLMISTKEGTVCVVKSEKLVGILTERDVVRSLTS